jgi:hypothetical protein
MNNNKFLDIYFENEAILLKAEYSEKRSLGTLLNYLNSLHSTADKLKDKFNCDIKNIPEFIILRVIRNYFHHVNDNDIDEYSFCVELEEWGIYENKIHIIISLNDLLKAIKHLKNQNMRNEKYLKKQITLMQEFLDNDFFDNIDELLTIDEILIDDKKYQLGVDIFKYVYNISNFIADKCREIDEVKNQPVIKNLHFTYTVSNNIPKNDFIGCVEKLPIMTTVGIVFPKNEKSIKVIKSKNEEIRRK